MSQCHRDILNAGRELRCPIFSRSIIEIDPSGFWRISRIILTSHGRFPTLGRESGVRGTPKTTYKWQSFTGFVLKFEFESAGPGAECSNARQTKKTVVLIHWSLWLWSINNPLKLLPRLSLYIGAPNQKNSQSMRCNNGQTFKRDDDSVWHTWPPHNWQLGSDR